METLEHLRLGNAIDYQNLHENPHLKQIDSVWHIRLFQMDGWMPTPLDHWMSFGDIVAMSGDFFTKAGFYKDLFVPEREPGELWYDAVTRMINYPVQPTEYQTIREAYADLPQHNPDGRHVSDIYAIEKKTYFPIGLINQLIQQALLYLSVPNYGPKLTQNFDHFSPWNIRTYVAGHNQALNYARLGYYFDSLAKDLNYNPEPKGDDDAAIKDTPLTIKTMINTYTSSDEIKQTMFKTLAHQFHAMAICMELFTFHFYSDAFAGGHSSRVGLARMLLTKKYGSTLAGILVNAMHNRDNRDGVIYDDRFDRSGNDDPDRVGMGDGEIDAPENQENMSACVRGMSQSLIDIDRVFYGKTKPLNQDFMGFDTLPDVNPNSPQTQPLFIDFNKELYVLKNLRQTRMFTALEYQALMQGDPSKYGYRKMGGKADALKLAVELKLLGFINKGTVIPLEPSPVADAASRSPVVNQMHPSTRRTVKSEKHCTSRYQWFQQPTATPSAPLVPTGPTI